MDSKLFLCPKLLKKFKLEFFTKTSNDMVVLICDPPIIGDRPPGEPLIVKQNDLFRLEGFFVFSVM